MKHFKKHEIVILVLVLSVVGLLTYTNLQVSIRRARDFQRKEDLVNIANDLEHFHEAKRLYPKSSADGRVIACKSDLETNKTVYKSCSWYFDSFYDDSGDNAYQSLLAGDPQTGLGASYLYVSSEKHFQLYAALEGSDEPEYSPAIFALGLHCGNRICNFGRSSTDTPLDKLLQ